MHKTLTLIKREFKSKAFTRGFLISTLLGPFFIVGITFFPALIDQYATETTLILQVVDESELLAGRLPEVFADTLHSGQPQFIVTAVRPSIYASAKGSFLEAVAAGQIDGLLIIPVNVLEGGVSRFISASPGNVNAVRIIRQHLNAEINKIRLERAGFDPGRIAELTSPLEVRTVDLDDAAGNRSTFDQKWQIAIFFLMVLYITILVYGTMVMRGVLEEKTSRILEVLLSSGNSFQLMIGKLIGVGSVGLMQYAIWSAVGLGALFVSGIIHPAILAAVDVSPERFVYFVVFFLIGYFQFSTLYAAVGAVSSSTEDAQALSTPIVFLIMIPLLVSMSLVVSSPEGGLTRLLSLQPFFAPMLMFMRTLISDPPFWEILLSIIINIAAILLFTWITARIYRVTILIYGKRPRFGEILRWIRYR